MEFPEDRWDFSRFYSEKPDYERFACKVLVAGAATIYLDIVQRSSGPEAGGVEGGAIDRVIGIFNRMLEEASGPQAKGFGELDPFSYHLSFQEAADAGAARLEYQERVSEFYESFLREFGEWDCVGLLGFDPFNYFDYDEETQAQIQSGEWMENCCGYMRAVVRLLYKEES